MLVKMHSSYRNVMAVCDEDLLGKTFEEGNRQIDIKEGFFGGDNKPEKEVIEEMRRFSDEDGTFNIVGVNSVAAALKAGVIKEDGVIRIQDIPIALVLL